MSADLNTQQESLSHNQTMQRCSKYTPSDIDISEYIVINVSGSKCKICGKVYIEHIPDVIRVHIHRHLGIKPYSCLKCNMCFSSRNDTHEHVVNVHRPKRYKCGICGKVFSQRHHLKDHSNIHKEDDKTLYNCDYCAQTFLLRSSIVTHIKNVHGNRDFLCPVCGKSFKCLISLNEHKTIMHSSIRKYKCTHCEKSFYSRSHFRKHMYSHIKVKRLTCDICKRTLRHRVSLIIHINRHEKKLAFKCVLCDKSYRSKHMLSEHTLKHQGIRKYVCKVCGKDFAQQSHLSTHKFVHAGKEFKCHLCGAKFNRNDNMKAHVKRHETNARPTKQIRKVKKVD